VVFGLGYKQPVTWHHSTEGGTRTVCATESSARGVLTAALICIAFAHTHGVLTFIEHVCTTSDRLALLNAALLV